jgi:hypothetical protein
LEDDMTLLSAAWFGRFFGEGTRLIARSLRDKKPPMKIEVERLPDYCWRDLGFRLPARGQE